MPDANATRQTRFDLCKNYIVCPKCYAGGGQGCIELTIAGRRYGYSYNTTVWEVEAAGAASGRGNSLAIMGRIARVGGAFRPIKGLHHQRWSALTNADVVVRLAMIEVEPSHDYDQAHA